MSKTAKKSFLKMYYTFTLSLIRNRNAAGFQQKIHVHIGTIYQIKGLLVASPTGQYLV